MDSKPPPALKRGPKVVARKSKEERDQLDQLAQQQRRDRDEAAEAARRLEERKRLQRYGIDTRPARASGPDRYNGNPVTYRRGRGGRGGFIGTRTTSRPSRQVNRSGNDSTEASAPAESSKPSTSTTRKPATTSQAFTLAKKVAGSSAKSRAPLVKDEVESEYKGSSIQPRAATPTYIYIGDEEHEDNQRGRDVDQPIEISESDSDAQGTRRQQLTFAPHRLQREMHKDREADINDQSSSSTVLPSQSDEKNRQSPTATRRKAKERVAVKPDPEAMEGVEAAAAQKTTEADPENEQDTAPGIAEFRPTESAQDDMDVDDEARNKKALLEKLRRTKRPGLPAFSTLEEREEYERHQDSLRNIAREFGQITVDSETDTIPESTNDELVSKPRQAGALDNATYLFQFPPIVPDLYAEKIKTEPGEAELNGADPKPENDERPAPPKAGESRRPYIEPGRVGKLRVHASGKMTLDWGGTALAAGQGMDINFLQSVMMMKLDADENLHGELDSSANGEMDGAPATPTTSQSTPRPARKKDWNGEVASFGQVRGKIVVTPDWAEILG